MPTLNKDQIRQSVDLPTKTLHLERWDGEVIVRAMPMASAAYTNFKNAPIDKKGTPPSREEYTQRQHVGAAILCTLDDEGNRIFNWSDVDWLREKHWNTVLEIATTAYELAANDKGIKDKLAEIVFDHGFDEIRQALTEMETELAVARGEREPAPEVVEADPLDPTNGSSENTPASEPSTD